MIIVLGSINLDLVVAVDRLPGRGETVSGPGHQSFPGGKGSNQSLAARRAGGEVTFVGAVGQDAFAEPALENLKNANVNLQHLRRLDGATGVAMIGVEASGENQIIVAKGVNAQVRAEWAAPLLSPDALVLMQGEVPEDQLTQAVEKARQAGARIMWNPAPVPSRELSPLIRNVDVLVVNEGEAERLGDYLGVATDPEGFAAALSETISLVVVTLGGDGLFAMSDGQSYRFSPPPVQVIDTTGAGDTFCGALAAALDRGETTGDALQQALIAGSLACTATGAQSSAPTLEQIKTLLDAQNH